MSENWGAYSDDLVAAWAADAQAKTRAYETYGAATEAPGEEDRAVFARMDSPYPKP